MDRAQVVCAVLLLTWSGSSHAFSRRWRTDVLSIHAVAPPAALLVVNTDGKRAGVDPGKPISPKGIGTVINEFPLADVDQQNIATDGPDDLRTTGPSTGWTVDVMDESPATYTVQLRGLAEGVADLSVFLILRPRPTNYSRPRLRIKALVTPGALREFLVSSDDEAMSVSALRVAHVGDLPASTGAAGRLRLITPGGVLQSLEAKARAATDSFARGNAEAARGALRAFLNELKAQGGKHVKEPALTILREEAEALLNPPPPLPKTSRKQKAGGAAKPAK